jgi:hypothetical protein
MDTESTVKWARKENTNSLARNRWTKSSLAMFWSRRFVTVSIKSRPVPILVLLSIMRATAWRLLCVVYLMTLTVTHLLWMIGWWQIWSGKDAEGSGRSQIWVTLPSFVLEVNKNKSDFAQVSYCPSWDSKPTSLEYMSEALSLEVSCSVLSTYSNRKFLRSILIFFLYEYFPQIVFTLQDIRHMLPTCVSSGMFVLHLPTLSLALTV